MRSPGRSRGNDPWTATAEVTIDPVELLSQITADLRTLAFIVFGVLLPLAAYPAAKRRLGDRRDAAGH